MNIPHLIGDLDKRTSAINFLQSIGPACLPEAGKDYRGHEKCILSGWGDVDKTDTSKVRADRLQKVGVANFDVILPF